MKTSAHTVRRMNLRVLIERHSKGNVAAFCRAYGLDPGYIWQLLNERRSFGEKSARNIEFKVGVAPGFMDGDPFPADMSITAAEWLSPGYGKSDEQPAKPAQDQSDQSVLEREQVHTFALPKTSTILIRSFAQIISKEQGTQPMIVFGEFPDSAYGYRLESDHMEGTPVYIPRGAVLVINPDLQPIDGDIVLANIEGPAIGLLSKVGGKHMVVATRDKIPALEVDRQNILGVILEWKVEHRNPARG